MKIKVKLLKPFSDIAGKGMVDIEFEEENVEQALLELCRLYPDLKKELFNEQGEVTFSVNIFVNDKPISALEDVNTRLDEGDEILIFMPVGGG
ncbi:MAG: MoaD family protein [Methanomassiliicoccales archaeon]|nr:MAG: MoaD family protein [Methanomassiliicoccales archaeon]